MDSQDTQQYSTQHSPEPISPAPRRRGRFGAKAALVAAGVVTGGILASTLTANAATSSSSSAATPSASASAAAGPGSCRGGAALSLSGTVTAVGTSSVTIKTASGTTTYAVNSSSDIDKNGEAQLSSLAVGDAVRFGTTTVNGTVTIDKLHAGNEALNMPKGAPTAGSSTGASTG